VAGSLLPGTSGRTFHLTRDRSPLRVPDPPLDEAALGGGPRLCIGSNLAMIQMRMVPYQRLNSLAPTGPLRAASPA